MGGLELNYFTRALAELQEQQDGGEEGPSLQQLVNAQDEVRRAPQHVQPGATSVTALLSCHVVVAGRCDAAALRRVRA